MSTNNFYKSVLSFFVLALMLTNLPVLAQRQQIIGEGEPVSQNRSASGFKGINVGGGFAVELTQDGKEGVRIEAQENLLNSIRTEVKDGVLHIYTTDNITTNKSLKAYVTVRELNSVNISGGVKVTGRSTFKANSFALDMSGGSQVALALETKRLTMDTSGGSKVNLTGRADEVRMEIVGATKVDASELEAQKVYVSASGASNLKVFAKNELSIDATGASRVSYKGNPTVTSSVSAAAKISKM